MYIYIHQFESHLTVCWINIYVYIYIYECILCESSQDLLFITLHYYI